jgi:DNA-binding SARP family transcriptional activator
MSRLEIATLGPPEIRLEGASLAGLASNKVRALLVYLAVESGRAHRRESLAGLLWPDYPERSARTNLSNALSNLRTALGDRDAAHPLLDVSRDTIQLNLGGRCCVDAVAFEACLERGQWQEAARAYRGPFLEGFSLPDSPAFEQWALLRRERAQRQAVEALGELAAGCERRDELGEAIRAVRRQLELEPWHEEGHRALMRLLARDGQRGAALAQYQVCRRTLQRELEGAPGRATQALYEAIRSGDVAPVKGRAGRRAEAGGPPSPAAVAAPEPASADRTLPAAVSPAPLSPGGERRWVTALHVELDQAATLLDQVGAEEWMRITAGALDIVVEVVHRYGAEVVERRAEGAVALFGVPVAHEDDAERAVLAALGVQAQVGDGPGLRIGVDAGEALVTLSGEHRQVVGRALALARRASVAAEPGTVSLGENAHRLVRRLFEWEEEAEGVASGTHRPLRRRADVGKARGIPGLSSPLVGRDAELQALQGAIDRLAAGVGGIVTIVGEAGIGKSRLVAEIRKHNLAKHTIGNKSRINLHVNKVY